MLNIRILTITHKVPDWLKTAYHDYAKRFTSPFQLELVEIPAEKRNASRSISSIIEKEGEKLIEATKKNHLIIALDVLGEIWSTESLSSTIKNCHQQGQSIDLLIGGPDGLSPACLKAANKVWSLSRLTFPHHIVRLILAEQCYRAISLLQNHPYHRG